MSHCGCCEVFSDDKEYAPQTCCKKCQDDHPVCLFCHRHFDLRQASVFSKDYRPVIIYLCNRCTKIRNRDQTGVIDYPFDNPRAFSCEVVE